jgi:TIR domain
MADARAVTRDFFVSFNQADRSWATWIAWVLEEAGYSIWFQDWDFRGNFVEHMNRAHAQADRTLAVLSDHYFGSDFTLAEWSARFAQDPAAREDRLVPVKVGSLTGENILGPIIYADLTECEESGARQRLLGRVKKAVDASYRDKPKGRPGFPGGPPREVPSKPVFPLVQSDQSVGLPDEKQRMPNGRSINIGGDAAGSVLVAGDSNRVNAHIEVSLTKTTLPAAASVDISQELAQIRSVLERIGGEHAGRMGRAMDDAAAELRNTPQNKDEIGAALGRALDYGKNSRHFADEVGQLAPHVLNAVAWLGANWNKLLPIVGLAI